MGSLMPPRGPKKVEPGDRKPESIFMYYRHKQMLRELDLTLAGGKSYAVRTLIEKEWNAQKRRCKRLARQNATEV